MSFRQVPLAQLVTDGAISYGVVQPGTGNSEGTPLLRVKDLRGNQIDLTDPIRVANDVSERHSRTILRGGEVLVSLVGSVGLAAVTDERVQGWNVARAIAVLRPVAEIGPQWLQLCLQSRAAQDQMRERLNTTVQATLNLADLRMIQVPVPDARTRAAITAVLGALDDKISSNLALVESSVALSRACYQSVPKEVSVPLSSLARFVNGKAFTKGATGSGKIVIRIAELNSGLGGSTVYNDIEVPEDHLARPGDLLFAWSGSLTVHRWCRPEAIINQHIFKVVPHGNYPMWLVNQALLGRLDDFKAIASDKATTMGHIQRRHLDEPVMLPAQAVVAQEDALMRNLWQMALAADVENLILAELRDTLLPALMSGRLRVKDVERQVEDAI